VQWVARQPLQSADHDLQRVLSHSGRVLLLTAHRRENWGAPMTEIARAARELLERFDDLLLLAPMHRNPIVRQSLLPILGNHPRAVLTEPLDYAPFVHAMRRADVILTDSGGVQEEAPAFGKPILVLRETTERPEGVAAGIAKLVGTDRARDRARDRAPADRPRRLRADGARGESLRRWTRCRTHSRNLTAGIAPKGVYLRFEATKYGAWA
jgi:UDP-N-acetylglucosamine 2-epimerase (non-hydrolysing)